MTSARAVLADGGRRRQQLPDEVATYVRELIMSGEVRPGEFLRMERIAEAVGVSNTPVREGLLSLSSEGLVHLVPRRGFVVAEFSPQDVRDMFWAQAQLAGELATRAARKVSADQLDRLAELVELHEQAVQGGQDSHAVASLNHAFHREVNLAADSEHLARLLASIVKHFPNRFYAEIEGQIQACRVDHPAILGALRSRDGRRARTLMHQHIYARADFLIAMLVERGVWDGRAEDQVDGSAAG
jgi:DNA-binding GntR family transcriptional regulator